MPARVPDQRRSTRLLRAPTWPALYIPRLDRSFAGRRDEKTFSIRGESAAAGEGRRYIAMDKSMHVSRAAYVSAFEHIPYSTRGSAIMHVASAHIRTTPLACVWGEHQYVSDIEVEKEQAVSTPHTRIPPNMAWSRLYRPPYAFRTAWASCLLCFPCREKHHLWQPLKRYSFACLFNATGNLPQIIGSSSR